MSSLPSESPVDPFYGTVVFALRKYEATAESQAVEAWRKERMLMLIRSIRTYMQSYQRLRTSAARGRLQPNINQLMDDLMALEPVAARPGMKRIPVGSAAIPRYRQQDWYLQLVRVGPHYYTRDTQQTQRLAHDRYLFVVLVSCPWEVRLGTYTSGGHPVMSRAADVYFAGEILFNQGKIQEWNNASGHYAPTTTLHPQVKNLLPPEFYKQKY